VALSVLLRTSRLDHWNEAPKGAGLLSHGIWFSVDDVAGGVLPHESLAMFGPLMQKQKKKEYKMFTWSQDPGEYFKNKYKNLARWVHSKTTS